MEAQDVVVFDGVGDGVVVQFASGRGLAWSCSDWPARLRSADSVAFCSKDRRAGEAEELGVGEEIFDGLVIVAELRAVAFVEDEDHALVAQRLEPLLVGRLALLVPALVALAVFVQRQAQFLDGA